MTTSPDALPQHKGRPVPWVTRWTGEVIQMPVQVAGDLSGKIRMFYEDGNEDRDDQGVLWQREGISRNGEPQYSQVSTYRQRTCMRKRRCQVCGSKIDSKVIRWLLPEHEPHMTKDGAVTTMSAPTCDECIPLAQELCPHLKSKGFKIYKVMDYRMWGVYGEGILMRGDDQVGRVKGNFPYGTPTLPHSAIIAKQQVVEFTTYAEEI